MWFWDFQWEQSGGNNQFILSLQRMSGYGSLYSFLNSFYQRKLQWWWLDKPPIYKYNRISLDIISLNFFSSHVCFYMVSGLPSFWFLAILEIKSRSTISWCYIIMLNHTLVGNSHMFCATTSQAYVKCRAYCIWRDLWLGWWPDLSFHSLQCNLH